MIFKSKVGTGISGTLRYVQGPGRDENGKAKEGQRATLLGGNGFGFEPRDERTVEIARRLMEQNGSPEMQGHKNLYCENDALHISLSWARGQTPDNAEKLEASRAFLKALGMERAMHLVYDHNDKSYSHIHIVASRLDPETGMAYDDYQRMYRGMHRAIEWEREKGQVTPPRQWCHDLADATRGKVDNDRLRELLFKNEATVRKTKLDLAMAFGGKFGPHLEAAREQFIESQPDLLRLKKYQAGRDYAYTTKDIWKEEAKVLAIAREIKERAGYGVEQDSLKKYADHFTLTEEQREALWWMTRDNGLAMLSGEAGTGKTRVLQCARDVYRDRGFNVRGMAFTNKVVQQLRADGFTESNTIDSELLRLKFAEEGRSPWDEKTILMIDEAAQIKTEHLLEVMRHAQKHGAKVIPVGDAKQLGSIEKGGLYSVMERRFGTARLKEVMRNQDPEQKKAWNAMHERKWREAVDRFKNAGAIHWENTKPESIKALVEEYTKDFLEDPEAKRLIMAATNDDVRELNTFAQDLRKRAGKLGPEMKMDTARGPVNFAVGDRIAMNETPNARDKRKGLINGAFGHVTALKELPNGQREMEIRLERKEKEQERVFRFKVGLNKEQEEVGGIGLGYASTVYKGQGATLDRTYVLHNPASAAPTNYVELSRHADKTKLYVSREDTSGYEDLTEQLKHGPDKTSAHAYVLDGEERAKLDRPEPSRREERAPPAKEAVRERREPPTVPREPVAQKPKRRNYAEIIDQLFAEPEDLKNRDKIERNPSLERALGGEMEL